MSSVLLVLTLKFTQSMQNSRKDRNTGILEIPTINADVPLNKTGNLPKLLKVCLGTRVMLTTNVDTADKLINGSCGQIKQMQVKYPNLLDQRTIYVKFDEPHAGNSKKNRNLPGELKECVPINLCPKRFHGRSSHTPLLLQEGSFLWYLIM